MQEIVYRFCHRSVLAIAIVAVQAALHGYQRSQALSAVQGCNDAEAYKLTCCSV